jgi:hypothetical protein
VGKVGFCDFGLREKPVCGGQRDEMIHSLVGVFDGLGDIDQC